MRWTPDLFDVFRSEYGYDLSDCLPQLHEEIGDWRKVRHDYFQLLNRLFVERWARPWYDYCAGKGISWTGHYWEHNWPLVTGVTDNMSMAAWQQVPGIDMLFNQFNEKSTGAQFGNIRSVKEVRSIANQLGRRRVLSETYGGGGWNVTFKDMKRLCDWQMVLGVNLVNQHVGHMSMAGVRKFDYPPMFNQSAAWWNDYRALNDYIARICAAMSLGEQRNDILVLEPTTSVWMYNQYYGTASLNRAMEIGQAFQDLVTELEHAQVEFDLGCENIFRTNGSVRDGKFVVGQRAYGTFVVAAADRKPRTRNVRYVARVRAHRRPADRFRASVPRGRRTVCGSGSFFCVGQRDFAGGMHTGSDRPLFAQRGHPVCPPGRGRSAPSPQGVRQRPDAAAGECFARRSIRRGSRAERETCGADGCARREGI